MTEYFSKWTWMRIAQLVVGIIFLGNYFDEGGFFNIAFGGMMFLQAALNWGCFSSKGCSTSNYNNKNSKNYQDEDIEFEEVV